MVIGHSPKPFDDLRKAGAVGHNPLIWLDPRIASQGAVDNRLPVRLSLQFGQTLVATRLVDGEETKSLQCQSETLMCVNFLMSSEGTDKKLMLES